MKLELKHLAPYLPYGLKMKHSNGNIFELDGLGNLKDGLGLCELHKTKSNKTLFRQVKMVKPILRPLSDLFKENKDCLNIPYTELIRPECYRWILVNDLDEIKLMTLDTLLMYHFDVFGLIEKGLAIDINTLNDE